MTSEPISPPSSGREAPEPTEQRLANIRQAVVDARDALQGESDLVITNAAKLFDDMDFVFARLTSLEAENDLMLKDLAAMFPGSQWADKLAARPAPSQGEPAT